MRLKTFSTLVATLLGSLSLAVSALPSFTPPMPEVAAKGYVLMDYQSGKILASNNADEQLHPASLTKMMTSYVVGREILAGNISETDKVMVSKNAWAKNFPDSSKMFIEVGKEVSVAELNRGIIVQSGNDACVAMAEHIAGTESGFASLMNTWAQELGMSGSHFVNSHGLDAKNHYTTAKDMATLARALIKDVPDEYAIYAEKSFTYNGIKQYNRNGLLWDQSLNVDGIKTGHTSKAGFSLVSSAVDNNMRLIAVVMGTKSANARKAESKKLLNFGFRFYESITPYKAGDKLADQKVWYGATDKVALGVLQDTSFVVLRGSQDKLKASFEIEQDLEAPILKGQVVGKVHFQVDGVDTASFKLVALDDVAEGSWFSRLLDYFSKLIASLFN